MDRLVLTRTLFPLDEVVYSIALYVFHERDLEKTIYWLCEFYYSGYEHKSWDLVWTLYYDFFAFSNPNNYSKSLFRYKEIINPPKTIENFTS